MKGTSSQNGFSELIFFVTEKGINCRNEELSCSDRFVPISLEKMNYVKATTRTHEGHKTLGKFKKYGAELLG